MGIVGSKIKKAIDLPLVAPQGTSSPTVIYGFFGVRGPVGTQLRCLSILRQHQRGIALAAPVEPCVKGGRLILGLLFLDLLFQGGHRIVVLKASREIIVTPRFV